MNFRINPIKFYAFLLIMSSLLSAPADAETNLTFCYDPYPPYTLGTEGEPSGGLKVNLLQAVVDRIDGLTADVVLLPWKRCQAEAKNGSVDGILPLFKNDERETYLTFTIGTFQETSELWYGREEHPEGLEWDGDFRSLSHLRLGMLNGGFINKEMEQEFESKQEILRARDVKALMQLLLKGRVDLIATDDAVGRYHIVQNGWRERIDTLGTPISSKTSHFGLSKTTGADKYVGEFNDVIEKLEAAGTIKEILLDTNYSQ